MYEIGTNITTETKLTIVNRFSFYVYPNPSSGLVNYKFEISKEAPIKLELFDVTGQLIWSERYATLKPGIYSNEFDLHLYSLARGVYYFRISNEEDQLSYPILFNNQD